MDLTHFHRLGTDFYFYTSCIYSWNDAEVEAFLDYLLANKSKMGESGSYLKVVFNSAAIWAPKKHGSTAKVNGLQYAFYASSSHFVMLISF